jgi:NAD-dependent deacetylase
MNSSIRLVAMIERQELIQRAAQEIIRARKVVAFTGAGISAESGIPTFRDPGGIWDHYDVNKFGTIQGMMKALSERPEEMLNMLKELLQTFKKAEPNPGHLALAELEKMGFINSVITQNGDNLHQDAGNTKVIELHGNIYRFRCMSGGRRFFPRIGRCKWKTKLSKSELESIFEKMVQKPEEFNMKNILNFLPKCNLCGGAMRPDVVAFGESVQNFDEAEAESRSCELMLAIGTSAVVYPAARLPEIVKRSGAKVVEINPQHTTLTRFADYFIPGRAGQVMPLVVKEVKALSKGSIDCG